MPKLDCASGDRGPLLPPLAKRLLAYLAISVLVFLFAAIIV